MIKKLIYILLILPVYLSGQNNFFWSHAGITVETNSLKDSVLAVWELDETEGTTVYDSYSDNDGTNTSATIDQTGVVSKAYDFNGTSSYVTVTSSDFKFNPLTESYSVSAWFKSADPDALNAGTYLYTFWDFIAGHSYPFRWSAQGTGDHQLDMVIYDGSANLVASIAGADLWDNTWHLVTMVVDHSAGYFYAYLDTTLKDSTEITFETFTPYDNSNLGIGCRNVTPDRYYDGLIDQASIWGRALTSEDLTDLYNDGSGIAYTSWQGTGATRYESGSTWSVSPIFTKTLNFTPDATWYSGAPNMGSNITEDDKYIFIVFSKDDYLNHVVYRINKSTGDTLSQIIQTDNAYYNDYHKIAALLVVGDSTFLVAVEQLPGNNNHNGVIEIFRWADTDSLHNYTSTVIGNTSTERLSYPFLYEAGDSIIVEARRYTTSPPYRVYYKSDDNGQTFSSMNEYISYGDADYWMYANQVGNNLGSNKYIYITPTYDVGYMIYQYFTILKTDFTGNFYAIDGTDLGTSVSGTELETYVTWGDTDKNTNLYIATAPKIFGSYLYALGFFGTRATSTIDIDSMQVVKANLNTGAITLGDAFATKFAATTAPPVMLFNIDGDIHAKISTGGDIYYYKLDADLNDMTLIGTDEGSYHGGLLTDMFSELSADYDPTTKQLRIYRFDDPDGL